MPLEKKNINPLSEKIILSNGVSRGERPFKNIFRRRPKVFCASDGRECVAGWRRRCRPPSKPAVLYKSNYKRATIVCGCVCGCVCTTKMMNNQMRPTPHTRYCSFFLSLSLSLTDTNTYTQRESVRYVDDAWTQQCIPVCGCLCLYIIYTWSACHVCVRERRYYVHELERERVRVCVECLSSVLFLIKGVYLCVCSLCSELETSTIIRTNKRSNLPVSIFYSFKNHF